MTILDPIRRAAASRPDAAALHELGRPSLAYRALIERIESVVQRLQGIGVSPGEPVAVVMPNGSDMALACLAVASCGACCPLNPEARGEELAFALDDLRPRALLVLEGLRTPARELAGGRGIPVLEVRPERNVGAGCFGLVATSGQQPAMVQATAARDPRPDDVALILHTSGTTARPKAVPLSHRNLGATATHLIRALDLGPGDVCLNPMPMFHVGALVDLLVPPLSAGGAVVCTPAFSAEDLPAHIREFAPTWLQVVPAMAQEILNRFRGRPAEFVGRGSLRYVRVVAAALPPALQTEFETTFDLPLIGVYGMTETATLIATNPLPPAVRKPGSVGRPAGPEVAIVGAGGQHLPSPGEGEVIVRGPNVMQGYRGEPAGAGDGFVDGWFRTGDVGYFDSDGYLFLTGRIKEIINRGGEKISPQSVDDVLRTHPAVADAASFAVAHPTLGEDIEAAVVTKAGAAVNATELYEFAAGRLVHFKVPRRLHFFETLPRTGNGKVRRAELAALVSGRAAAQHDGQPNGNGDSTVGRSATAAPTTPLERFLAARWAQLLERPTVDLDGHFFELGGDSLKAATLVNELQRRGGEPILVSALFDAPTLEAFATLLHHNHPNLARQLVSEGQTDSGQPAAQPPRVRRRVTPATRAAFLESFVRLGRLDRATGPKNPAAVFVLCPPRSGSTLLRAMLAGHPKLFAPPELYLLSFHNLAERRACFAGAQRGHLEGNLRALMQLRGLSAEGAKAWMADLERRALPVREYYGMLQAWLGDRILVDKTPFYGAHPETLREAEASFDQPRYIHLLRHPHAVVHSFEDLQMERLWYPRLTGRQYAGEADCPYESAEMGELVWSTVHQNIVDFLAPIPAERQHTVRYEELVTHPEAAMRALCSFLDLEFAPAMLHPQADPAARMTDGIHTVSQMVGDVKFHQHTGIDRSRAHGWQQAVGDDFLSPETWALANHLGYTERPRPPTSSAAARHIFEL